MKKEEIISAVAAAVAGRPPTFDLPQRGHTSINSYRKFTACYPDGHDDKFFTVVGSRNTPQPELDLLHDYSVRLLGHGLIGRSGGAGGADHQLTLAALKYDSKTCEIYLPWDGFEGYVSGHLKGAFIVAPWLDNYAKARSMASDVHPVWSKLGTGVRMMHTRNAYQPLGLDLKTPSEFVLFSAPESNGGVVSGGTATAIKMARDAGIPTFNMRNESQRDEFAAWLDEWEASNQEWICQKRRVDDEYIRQASRRP